ncbi:matrixin family metalloprotease [Lactobacillus sp. ESL0791]|uniref:matrixin family metalloprotease n=1 Tax=Lactobacillus sp. ESL0791 TaxID=2983234 RepID=UPI0023FA419A|nr:matrixin family metalloprotease [Lactobacillus sp. ESL0791]MDF7638137.1 matrixin family metalloprotease [Lactobacillus sp. ESL0791]
MKKNYLISLMAVLTISGALPLTTMQANTVVAAKKTKKQKRKKKKQRAVKKQTELYEDETTATIAATPKISYFTPEIISQYHLSTHAFAKTTITYDDTALPSEQQEVFEQVIKQINDLDLVKLVATVGDADITVVDTTNNDENNSHCADTSISYSHEQSKGLYLNEHAAMSIYLNSINAIFTKAGSHTLGQEQHYYKIIFAHELGHALGLEHNPASSIMNAEATYDANTKYKADSTKPILDQEYIQSLAILYK